MISQYRLIKVGQEELSVNTEEDEETYPGENTRIIAVLANGHLQLTVELDLLGGVGQDGLKGTIWRREVLERPESWHILYNKQSELVAGLIVQVHFNFHPFRVSKDLNGPKRCQTHMLPESVISQLFQRKQVESHSLHVRRRINAIWPVALQNYHVSVDVLPQETSRSHISQLGRSRFRT